MGTFIFILVLLGGAYVGYLYIKTKKEYSQSVKEYEDKVSNLRTEVENEKSMEKRDLEEIERKIETKKGHLGEVKEDVVQYKEKTQELLKDIRDNNIKIDELKRLTGDLESRALYQEYGVHEPEFEFSKSLGYKNRLKEIRDEQKESIKDKTAVNYPKGWEINGSLAEGKKMVENNIKQIMRTFNNECDVIIGKVKVSNISSLRDRIDRAFTQINKLNKSNQLSISDKYLRLKLEEIKLAYHYELKKDEEKEEIKLQKEKEKEEKALQKEIEKEKKKADKDITHHENVILKLQEQLKEQQDEESRARAEREIRELQSRVEEKEKEKDELTNQSLNASAGYVYIISNIGSFGQDVVKIGVTRRLEPLERIKELSGASVPFVFDVHALVFSNQAYELEAELHNYFKKYRINKVNNRKEFFHIPIDKIESKLEEYGNLTIDFTKEPKAEEYYKTLSLSER